MLSRNRYISYVIWPAFLFILVRYHLEITRGGHEWITAEWLINFEGGLTRRGLIGSILLIIADLGFPLKWVVYTTQCVVFFFVFFLTHRLYLLRERESAWLIVLLSPAFLLFSFYDLGGILRKEQLVFVSFLILALGYAGSKTSLTTILLSVILYAIAAFSHEIAALTLPFFVYLVIRMYLERDISGRNAVFAAAVFSLLSLLSLLFAIVYSGNQAIGSAVCASVMSRGFEVSICEGAIRWLGFDAAEGFAHLRHFLPVYGLYVYWLLLAFVPLFMSAWTRKHSLFLVVGFVAISPLFLVAIDWGRWLHVYIFFVFVTMMACSVRKEVKLMSVPGWLLFLYLVAWHVPHCCAEPLPGGFAAMTINLIEPFF